MSSETLEEKLAELQSRFEKQATRTPLLFNRAKTDEHLVMTFISAYYNPIISNRDEVSLDEQLYTDQSQTKL